ncbi:MAG TPA: AAA family ATPase [Kofleriaceae bacterium]|nr:AAA family ATPase [Kofleriaceae bacterium]
MRVQFTVGVYQARRPRDEAWIALVPARYTAEVTGKGDVRLRERLLERLREVLRKVPPLDQDLFQLPLGTELVHLPVDLKAQSGRIHGTVPLIAEPRWTGEDRQRLMVYHPRRRHEWFLATDRDDLTALAPAFFRRYWAELDEGTAAALLSDRRDRLVTLGVSCEPQSLLARLPRQKDDRAAASWRTERVLRTLGIDETQRLTSSAPAGVPRSPYRERLAYLLGGARPRSVAVVGPPGAGKSTLIRQWIADRLVEDGYPIHKNLDRIHHVWRLSGKRLIAGMSYLGQWEQRCLAVLEEARAHQGMLWIEDLHLFGRLGQSRQSERSFADFFRGPIRRGDLAVIAELTPEHHARLERDAPGLAEALALVAVPAASPAETAQLLLHEARALETQLAVAIHPLAPRTALELGAALFPWRARPGVAIELVRRVAEQAAAQRLDRELTPGDVLDHVARVTGLVPEMLSLDAALDPAEVEAAFARRVIGQPAATRAATDVVLRVRAGLADPGRPIGVLLFTGPTGTGKTELATAVAEYLYGDHSRLIRLDMGELSGPDAVARLIGDRWNPEGLLTSRVRAQPFCVVLLDEIEKAHTQVLHLLLQLFDEGRLTDAAGDVASFASAVVIMTSNLGARSAAPIGFGDTRDRILADVARAVREFFPVELFNRIDQVVPFEPLTPEVAAAVVDKELARLLTRRGLRERNTFVYTGAAVRRRAVADAFDPRYGARTVKRWLEDRIGGALTDLLAAAPPARLRIVRLSEHAGAIAATLEPLHDRASDPGPYLLDGLLDASAAALEPATAVAAAAVDRVRRSPALAAARRDATGDLRYYVDELAQRLDALDELFARRASRKPERMAARRDDLDDDHREALYGELTTDRDTGTRWNRSRGAPRVLPPASRDALIAGIAEALLIERALPELLDPAAHAVTAVISQVGATIGANGISLVTEALRRAAWIDGGAQLVSGGTVHEVPAHGSVSVLARDAVFELRGLFVRAALAGDHGTWMIRAAATEPEVVRVELRAGIVAPPHELLRAHVAARRELDRVLEAGGALPPNPDVLLPVTRVVTYRDPLRPGDGYAVEIEDFSTGWVDRTVVSDLQIAVRRAWHLAWSKRP